MAIKSDFTKAVYDVKQLNQLTGCIISDGIVGQDSLKVTYKKGTAVVGGGRYILPDKSVLTVEDSGYIIPESVTDGYIYIHNGVIQWGEFPTGGDVSLLAHIEEGICHDLRKHSYIYIREAGERIEL